MIYLTRIIRSSFIWLILGGLPALLIGCGANPGAKLNKHPNHEGNFNPVKTVFYKHLWVPTQVKPNLSQPGALIGAYIESTNPTSLTRGRYHKGVRIKEIILSGPCDKAGIQPGDIVVAIENVFLDHIAQDSEVYLRKQLQHKNQSDLFDLTVIRPLLKNSQPPYVEKTFTLVLAQKPIANLKIQNYTSLFSAHPDSPSTLQTALDKLGLDQDFDSVVQMIADISITHEGFTFFPDHPVPFRNPRVVYALQHPLNTLPLADYMAQDILSSTTESSFPASTLRRMLKYRSTNPTYDHRDITVNTNELNKTVHSDHPLDQLIAKTNRLMALSEQSLSALSRSDRKLLSAKLATLYLSMRYSNQQIDQEELMHMMSLVLNLDLDSLLDIHTAFVDIFDQSFLDSLFTDLKTYTPIDVPQPYKDQFTGDILFLKETEIGLVVVGGSGPNTYKKDAQIIIDIGGNDTYLNHCAASSLDFPFAAVVDYSGNDLYLTKDPYPSQGAGILGSGVLIDLSGRDGYYADRLSQGMGILGIGLIMDQSGEDYYQINSLGQGAGILGAGAIVDFKGHDRYQGELFCQGFGGTGGLGLLADISGWDTYRAGFYRHDQRDPTISFSSHSQGYAFGCRPNPKNGLGLSGGIGMIVDGSGSDIYICDYFGQGAAYYYGMGILYDRSGNDAYRSGSYAQGAGTHYAVGALLDLSGNDTYHCYTALGIGEAHDYSVGILFDQSGDDQYFGGLWTSLAAGSANGIGMVLDLNGNDRYMAQDPSRCIATGLFAKSRNNGSFGILMDLGQGQDRYDDKRLKNNSTQIKPDSSWGVFIDQ